MPYYGQNASAVGVPFAAPDLSNVMDMAKSAGQNAAYANFLEDLLKQRKAQAKEAKARETAAQAAAAEEASNNDGKSFLDKLGDGTLGALEWTLDKASRPLYAVANATKYVMDQDKDKHDNPNFVEALTTGILGKNPFHVVDDLNFGDVGGALKAAWEGLSGEEKTTGSDIIKANAKDYEEGSAARKLYGNSVYQGIAGFGADVALDPLSYVGAGLVTKPLKGIVKHSLDNELADDLAKAGLKRADIADDAAKSELGAKDLDELLTADDFKSIMGQLSDNPGYARPVGLTGKAGRRYDKAHELKGRQALIPKSGSIARTKYRMDTMSRISEALGKKIDHPEATSKIKSMLDDAERSYKQAVEESGSRAFKAALAKAEKTVPDATGAVKSVKYAKAASFAKISNLMRHASTRDTYRNALARAKNPKEVADLEGKLSEVETRMAEEAKGWADHPALTKDVLDQAWKSTKSFSNKDAGTRALVNKAIQSKRTAVQLQQKLGKDHAEVQKAWSAHNRVNAKINERRAVIFRRTLANRAGLEGAIPLPKNVENRVTEIDAELSQVEEALKSHSTQYSAEGSAIQSGGNPTEIKHLKDTRTALEKERNDIFAEHLGKDLFNPQSVEGLADQKFNTWMGAHKAFRRKAVDGNYRVQDLPDELKPYFGAREGQKGVVPKIVVDGKEILKDTKSKPALRALKTEADESALQDKAKLETFIEGLAKDGKPVVQHTGVHTPVEYRVFDRLFKEQNGITVHEASRRLQLAEGNYVQFGKEKITRSEFIDWALDHPAELSKARIKIPVGKVKEIVNKSTDEVIGTEQKIANAKFADPEGSWLETTPEGLRNKTLMDFFKNHSESARELRAAKGEGEFNDTALINEKRAEFTREAEQELGDQAEKQAIDRADLMLPEPSPEDILEGGKLAARAEFEQAAEAARQATMNAPDALGTKRWELANKITQLRKAYDQEVAQFDEAYDEAVRTRAEVKKRLDEEITLRAIDDADRFGRTSLRIGTMGLNRGVDIPLSEQMIKGVEAFSRAPVIGKAWQTWSNAFSPASKLEPEMNLARKRVQSLTPEIIGHHMTDFKAKYKDIPLAARKAALNSIRTGNLNTEASRKIAEGFDEMVKYLDGSIKFDDVALTPYEIGKYLPAQYHFISPTGSKLPPITSGQDIVRLMRNMPKDEDATKALWALRIAVEQTMAKQAMNKTLRDTFGIRRELPTVKKMGELSNKGKLIEQMREVHGWKTVDGIGDSHYFPPDVAEDIKKLQDIIKPQKVHELVQLHDKVLRTWKATVTVYNPGYYVRNGIGETMMGLFDGLSDPRYYAKARSVLKARPEMADPTREFLKELTPWKKYESLGASKGRPVVKLPNGKTLTAEEVDILYHDVGLKTGFIATDYQNMMPDTAGLGNSAIGKAAGSTNDFIRRKGEGFEDYFRLAHFMYRLENPVQGRSAARGLDALELAQDASIPVRKYHFDYTDFTSFEKTAMMRAFPFYKWTRKAFPLMGSMLMTKPGLVTLYPKFMNDMSYATGAIDPANDENGILPNYEGIVPKWMKDMFAYPVGTGDQAGAMDFMNIATPALDVYKMANDPVGTMFGMMNPLIKAPLEQLRGETLDPEFKIDLTKDGNRQNHLMDQTPLTNLLDKIMEGGDDSAITEPGAPIDETLLSYLSGLGIYENNEKRQKGEQMRANFAKGN